MSSFEREAAGKYHDVGDRRMLLPKDWTDAVQARGVIRYMGVGVVTAVEEDGAVFDVEGTEISTPQCWHMDPEEWERFSFGAIVKGLGLEYVEPQEYLLERKILENPDNPHS